MELINEIVGKKNLSDDEKIRLDKIELGRNNFWEYAKLIDPKFFNEKRQYLKRIANDLQAFYEKKLINLTTLKSYRYFILNLPPGGGKSYTIAMFVTWAYGKDIYNKVVSISYNQILSSRFSKSVRGKIEDRSEKGNLNDFSVIDFFPLVKIKYGDSATNVWALEKCDMSYLASSFDGTLTGMRGNIGVIDDPIKSAAEAVNERIKESHWDFYKNTFKSRMLDGAIEIIVQTRWATDDLAGKLLAEKKEQCYVLCIKALDENGNSFCEDLYSTDDLLEKKATLDEEIWLANYMQEPIDKTGALYGTFKTYDVYDEDSVKRKIAYTDTADEGSDYLCSICADEIDGYAYITDIYYTQDPMEVTEKEVARRYTVYGTREALIESNNGGRGFARNVINFLKSPFKNKKCIVTWFHQSKNKKTRIIVNSSNVMEQVIMPEGWEKKYPEFATAIKKYQRKGKNEHDDAEDAITGLVEFINGDVKGKKKMKLLSKKLLGL
ncbi:phage terminase large subunit [Peptoanaerobacter stomatis]